MKKIKITESQAKNLGLIKENDDSGLKSVGTALGAKPIRIVISGENLPKFKDFIIKAIMRVDKEAKLNYFEATQKIVGTVSETKMSAIKRDVSTIDPTIVLEKKPLLKALKEADKKNVFKITKEQYNRIFASGLIENFDKVDKNFKQASSTGKIENLKEDNFDISKPKPSLSSSVQGKFGKELNETNKDIEKEVVELIKFLYRKTDELSPYWTDNNITFDDIIKKLTEKNIIFSNNGKHLISKKLGPAQNALEALKTALNELINEKKNVEIEEESGGYAPGTETDSNSPWNQTKTDATPFKPEVKYFTVITYNSELAILKDKEGHLYTFVYDHIPVENFEKYSSKQGNFIGKNSDGEPEYETSEDIIDNESIENFINDNVNSLSKGEGIMGFENGDDLVKIDNKLVIELQKLYDKDKNIMKVFGIQETTSAASSGSFTGPLASEPIKRGIEPLINEEVDKTYTHFALNKADNKIVNGWDYSTLYDSETKGYDKQSIGEYSKSDLKDMFPSAKMSEFKILTKNALLKSNIDPNNSENWYKFDLNEMTSGDSGAYDANALPNIGRNGEFKKNPSKPKAFTKTQFAGGGFVNLDSCTKLNNNDSSKNGKCSQGAVDNVVKVKKTASNINAPSLNN